MKRETIFILSWYAAGYLVLVYYGGSVCPYIEGLGVPKFAAELAAVFFAGLFFRFALGLILLQSPLRDFFVFFFMAAGLTTYNRVYYDFPVASGLKAAVGFMALGFFISVQAYLAQQRQLLRGATLSHIGLSERSSIITRISTVTILAVLLSTATIFLVVNKDLKWLATQQPGLIEYYRPSVLKEIVYVMGVLLLLLISVIVAYARNLQLLFKNQTQALEEVSVGNLNARVPVVTNDEFGNIASYTNAMIAGLKEKQKIQSIFGKMVSPGIAERLLADNHQAITGEKLEVTVLMADVRNFTTLSENISPEELVALMNRYFTVMVEIIHRHGGEIDKFIGDGILAIFGLTDDKIGPDGAVGAAAEMVVAARKLSAELKQEIKIGLGIHAGEVIAGRVGSPDRQEFTFLGDTVNTAARLESASKDLGRDIVISKSVFDELCPKLREKAWQIVGSLTLKGKRNTIETFALSVT